MKRKRLYTGVAVIVFSGFIYILTGTKNSEKLMQEYLEGKGFSTAEIQSIDVNHSFLNAVLSYNEWNIHVQYADEPEAIYIYTVNNGEIIEAGVSGSVAKEDLKHISLE